MWCAKGGVCPSLGSQVWGHSPTRPRRVGPPLFRDGPVAPEGACTIVEVTDVASRVET